MKVFVTGSTGFVGVPLVRELLRRGHEVRALVRDRSSAERTFDAKSVPGLTLIQGDLFDRAKLAENMHGCEAVFHVAGMVSYRNSQRQEVRRTNVTGTANVVDAAVRAGIARFVHTSSIVAVGGSRDPAHVLDESAAYNASELNLEYFDSKRDAEREVLKGVARGLNAVIVNPGTIAGLPEHSGRAGSVTRSIRMLARFPALLPGGNSWVDVRDVVEGHLLALEKGRTGERYILTAENISNAEVTRRLADARGHRGPRPEIPANLLRTLARWAPVGSQLLTRVSGFYLFFDAAKARKELGWSSRSPWPAMEAMAIT